MATRSHYLLRKEEGLLKILAAYRVSSSLIHQLYPEVERVKLVRYLSQYMGYSTQSALRNRWDTDYWLDRLVDPRYTAHINALINMHAEIERLQNPEGLAPERVAIVHAIDHYLRYTGEPQFTAEGAYAVLHHHLAQQSTLRTCRECEGTYWVFHETQRCPICAPTLRRTCIVCGQGFYAPHAFGRPREICSPECRQQRRRKRSGGTPTAQKTPRQVRRKVAG